jgi:hypothetical protein
MQFMWSLLITEGSLTYKAHKVWFKNRRLTGTNGACGLIFRSADSWHQQNIWSDLRTGDSRTDKEHVIWPETWRFADIYSTYDRTGDPLTDAVTHRHLWYMLPDLRAGDSQTHGYGSCDLVLEPVDSQTYTVHGIRSRNHRHTDIEYLKGAPTKHDRHSWKEYLTLRLWLADSSDRLYLQKRLY